MVNDYLTAAEVADLLRVSRPTVLAAVKKQGLPAVRLGRVWRFPRADVEAWLEEQKTKGASDGGRAA
jgi:excisionase family DNA binding protein